LSSIKIYATGSIIEGVGTLIYFERDTGKFAYWIDEGRDGKVMVSGRCSNSLIGKVKIDGEVVYERESKP